MSDSQPRQEHHHTSRPITGSERSMLHQYGALAQEDEDLADVRLFAPNLVPIAKRLLADSGGTAYIISAGPQPQAAGYDPDEEPYFFVGSDVAHPGFTWPSCEMWIQVMAQQVNVWIIFDTPTDGTPYVRDVAILTHDELAAYLRSLPKPIDVFPDLELAHPIESPEDTTNE